MSDRLEEIKASRRHPHQWMRFDDAGWLVAEVERLRDMVAWWHETLLEQRNSAEAEVVALRGALQAATELLDWLCENGYIVGSHLDLIPDERIQRWRDAALALLGQQEAP